MLLLELSYVAPVSSTGTVFVPWMPEVFLFLGGGGDNLRCFSVLRSARNNSFLRFRPHGMALHVDENENDKKGTVQWNLTLRIPS